MLPKYYSLLIALGFLAINCGFSPEKTLTTNYKGKRITWASKPILLKSDNPQAEQKDKERYVYERLGMLQYEGREVMPSKEKSIIKEVQKQVHKASKSLTQPKAKGRAMKIKFTNFLVDETGKIVFHEVLLYPFQEEIQLYPNELTAEMKSYLKELDKIVETLKVNNKSQKLLFFDATIDL
jgi:hypothetical protein